VGVLQAHFLLLLQAEVMVSTFRPQIPIETGVHTSLALQFVQQPFTTKANSFGTPPLNTSCTSPTPPYKRIACFTMPHMSSASPNHA
jgi:hypothetical protein